MQLCVETIIPLPQDEVFAFHQSPAHLGILMAEWKPFRLLHCRDTVALGGETWFEENVFGCLPVVMGFRCTAFEAPLFFEDTLIHGPFKTFVHRHEFELVDDGTCVRDRLDVQLPLKYGGPVMEFALLASQFRRVLAYRHEMLHRLVREGGLSAAGGTL